MRPGVHLIRYQSGSERIQLMSKQKRGKAAGSAFMQPLSAFQTHAKIVESLLDAIEDGNEYGSIISVVPKVGLDLVDEIIRGLTEIETFRSRPCLAYVGNVIKPGNGESGIDSLDDLPFAEMVRRVPQGEDKVDVFLSTRGGSAHQVSRFVNCLRAKFKEVDFLIPSFCMSAGTLFALSGNRIWMNPLACLGPIDPQVPTKDGRYVPAQALLLLIGELQRQGDEAMREGHPVPWTAVRIVDSLDKKELGDAITATHYSRMMASQFLQQFKFNGWTIRETSRQPVTPEYKEARANEIATGLVSHDRWLSHGHAIPRDVLWNEIKLHIDHPPPDLEKAITRLWALFYWIFDKTSIMKAIVSRSYRFVRHAVTLERQQ